jgi:hypothetical protein
MDEKRYLINDSKCGSRKKWFHIYYNESNEAKVTIFSHCIEKGLDQNMTPYHATLHCKHVTLLTSGIDEK